MDTTVWLVGAGYMAREYCKVLQDIGVHVKVIGRGEDSARKFERDTGLSVVRGGVKNCDLLGGEPKYAIVAVPPLALKETALYLIEKGVAHILLEKPGGMNVAEMEAIREAADRRGCEVYVGYNRRFYQSVLEANRRIKNDGGITSFNFEFTEWPELIMRTDRPIEELREWFLANSSHVVDLAFFFGGSPIDISCYVSGSMNWYEKASAFAGAGRTDKGIIFSYKANWNSAGRWSVEVLTAKHKYLFEPMEKLQMQDKGSVDVYDVELDDKLDIMYKPGLYLQTKAFFEGDVGNIVTIEEQVKHTKIYFLMEHNSHSLI